MKEFMVERAELIAERLFSAKIALVEAQKRSEDGVEFYHILAKSEVGAIAFLGVCKGKKYKFFRNLNGSNNDLVDLIKFGSGGITISTGDTGLRVMEILDEKI